jgi:hypothetical protein
MLQHALPFPRPAVTPLRCKESTQPHCQPLQLRRCTSPHIEQVRQLGQVQQRGAQIHERKNQEPCSSSGRASRASRSAALGQMWKRCSSQLPSGNSKIARDQVCSWHTASERLLIWQVCNMRVSKGLLSSFMSSSGSATTITHGSITQGSHNHTVKDSPPPAHPHLAGACLGGKTPQ